MKFLSALLFAIAFAPSAHAVPLIEYHMHMKPAPAGQKRVALTFDACTGKVDERILETLVKDEVKATIFVTARWLKRNPAAIATFKAHPELFQIENHGAKHLPAIDVPEPVYGLVPAGSPKAVSEEVENGAAAVQARFGHWPKWYRGAAAEYTATSLELIKSLGFEVAGFSMSGDGGASWTSDHAAHAVAAAQDGDVIIAHINQPKKPAGAGVVQGMLKLKAEGFTFVRLNEGF
ncbi:polysaccharide deacetylase family protein [Aestuariivirga litoralis]|uniref:polysaccharide deacetylase family protein n=1 Tax=Aestuariivirga litoralis TaxID=2650924 RepID=UPI0018C6C0CE|nr:polysaccharide deacetylase family protein [Aestuariivirga litoralis]MBG1233295.1 polysaccharide deacetylase family protein [Aestuariivirga litoralis]